MAAPSARGATTCRGPMVRVILDDDGTPGITTHGLYRFVPLIRD